MTDARMLGSRLSIASRLSAHLPEARIARVLRPELIATDRAALGGKGRVGSTAQGRRSHTRLKA